MPNLLERLNAVLADRYTVESEIGRGGMATVFLAEDLKHHRQVAIKVLHPELASAVGTERFLNEVEIVAGLTHPHILTLIDSGEADGLVYFVMPFVTGESLRDRIERERQLPIDDALQIAREVAEALGYAHSHGVVHRDIKPGNILLEEGHAVITDFGVAKAMGEVGEDKLTSTGMAVGTPAYMSPEQGSAEEAPDGRTDIYALGCVLYEMLAGEPPFTGATPQIVMKRHSLDPVPSLKTARETAPESVEHTIQKAMAKVPADRFQTADDFIRGLAAPRPAADPRWTFRRMVTAVVGVAAVVTAGFFLGSERRSDSADQVRVVLAEPEVEVEDPVLGQVVQTGLEIALVSSREIAAVTGEDIDRALVAMGRDAGTVLNREIALEVAIRTGAAGVVLAGLQRLGTGSLIVKATLLANDGSTRAIVQKQASSDDVLIPVLDTLSLDLRAELGESANDLEETPSLLHLLTPSMEAARLYVEAQVAMREHGDEFRALTLLEQAVALDPDFAYAWGFLLALRQNAFGDHLEAIERSYQLADRMLPHQRLLFEAAAADLIRRDRMAAIELYQQSIEHPTPDALADPDYPETPYGLMGLAYLEIGEPRQGDSVFAELMQLVEQGEASAALHILHLNRGIALAQQGAWADAELHMARNAELVGEGFAWYGRSFIETAGGCWADAVRTLRGAQSSWSNPGFRYMGGLFIGTLEAVRGRPEASRGAFTLASEAAAELGNPLADLLIRISWAEAEFFALADAQRASAHIVDFLKEEPPRVGLARRFHARAQALSAAICASRSAPPVEGPASRLPCGAEIVTDSILDTIETLEARGWRAVVESRLDDAHHIAGDPLLSRAGGPGLRARAPAAAAHARLSAPDSAAAIYRAIATAPFGLVTNAPPAILMRSYALRRLAAMGGEVGDSAAVVLRQDWAEAETEFLARVADPLIGRLP